MSAQRVLIIAAIVVVTMAIVNRVPALKQLVG